MNLRDFFKELEESGDVTTDSTRYLRVRGGEGDEDRGELETMYPDSTKWEFNDRITKKHYEFKNLKAAKKGIKELGFYIDDSESY